MTSFELLAAFTLDRILGDPLWLPHPVRWMGKLIGVADRFLRPRNPHRWKERTGGLLLAAGLPLLVYFLSEQLIRQIEKVEPWGAKILTVLLAFTALAAGSLRSEALAIRSALMASRLPEARRLLSRIVSRTTEGMLERDILRGAIESVAENASDGVIAPLCYLLIGGVPLALAYKAINTLDSMVGYRNERYRDFGWASARLDDLANWIPARLTALLMVVAAFFLREDPREAWRILRRDGGKDDSPNSGRPEAAVAGALRIQLGGPVTYKSGRIEKPTIGDLGEPLNVESLDRAVRLMDVSSSLMVLICAGFLWTR